MRIDKFLKNSRIIKRRTVAKEACEQGRVIVNGKTAKPGTEVAEGDILKITFSGGDLTVKILSTKDHVTKEEARNIYEIITKY
jgi:ribosomal 50S subunit-recycling heat shock protein